MAEMRNGSSLFTGIRPTGQLTLANFAGAIKPVIDIQSDGLHNYGGLAPLVFVADIHALTDQHPDTVRKNRLETVKALISLGLEPDKTDVFIQSQIEAEVLETTFMLGRLMTLGQLVRVPTLKEKVKDPNAANLLLLQYPVLMAADIILQRPVSVPVGKDQTSHLEATRNLVDKINSENADSAPNIPLPGYVFREDPPNVLALKGDGKMSKSNPSSAILLDEKTNVTEAKIRKSQTSTAGSASPHMESLIRLVGSIDPVASVDMQQLYDQHVLDPNARVASTFKDIAVDSVVVFLQKYQTKRVRLESDRHIVDAVLKRSSGRAHKNALETLGVLRSSISIAPYCSL